MYRPRLFLLKGEWGRTYAYVLFSQPQLSKCAIKPLDVFTNLVSTINLMQKWWRKDSFSIRFRRTRHPCWDTCSQCCSANDALHSAQLWPLPAWCDHCHQTMSCDAKKSNLNCQLDKHNSQNPIEHKKNTLTCRTTPFFSLGGRRKKREREREITETSTCFEPRTKKLIPSFFRGKRWPLKRPSRYTWIKDEGWNCSKLYPENIPR